MAGEIMIGEGREGEEMEGNEYFSSLYHLTIYTEQRNLFHPYFSSKILLLSSFV
jgi:hypothetical protein